MQMIVFVKGEPIIFLFMFGWLFCAVKREVTKIKQEELSWSCDLSMVATWEEEHLYEEKNCYVGHNVK